MLFMLPLHSFYLRIHRKSFVKLGEGERKLSRPHYIKLLVFFMSTDNPDELQRMKNQLARKCCRFYIPPLWDCPPARCENRFASFF